MAGFSDRFRRKNNSGNNGADAWADDIKQDEMTDGFGDFSQDGMTDGFGDFSQDEMTDGFGDFPQDGMPDDSGNRRDDVDLRKSFGMLVRAISDKFREITSGRKGGKNGEGYANADSSDSSFASRYDEALDGDINDGGFSDDFGGGPDGSFSDDFGGGPDGDFNEDFGSAPDGDFNEDFGSAPDGSFSDDFGGTPDGSFSDDFGGVPDGQEDTYSENDAGSEETSHDSGEEYTRGGLMSAVLAAFDRFRRRLPGFRPKFYTVPQPSYKAEDDGIRNPTLASDIQKIIEEQNRHGDVEREYDEMRNYIRSVSTDSRLRPEDVRRPDNYDEVRAAESELYDLIAEISDRNEQQRGRIGSVDILHDDDPYNYRGINDDRLSYTPDEGDCFELEGRYGFESERKVDPGREDAEREYNSTFIERFSSQVGIGHSGDSFAPRNEAPQRGRFDRHREAPQEGGRFDRRREAPQGGGRFDRRREAPQGGRFDRRREAPQEGGRSDRRREAPQEGGRSDRRREAPQGGGRSDRRREAPQEGGGRYDRRREAPQDGSRSDRRREAPQEGGRSDRRNGRDRTQRGR